MRAVPGVLMRIKTSMVRSTPPSMTTLREAPAVAKTTTIGREIGAVVPQVTLSAQHYIPCPGRHVPNLNGGHALDVLCLLLESWCPHLLQLSDNLRDDRSNREARGVRRARGQTWQEIEIDEHCVGATGIGREVLDDADCGVPAHHLHGLPCRSRGILGL